MAGNAFIKKWGGIVLDAVPFLTWKSGDNKKAHLERRA